eukprot:945529-Alexandrium_andersonii.AAC.1
MLGHHPNSHIGQLKCWGSRRPLHFAYKPPRRASRSAGSALPLRHCAAHAKRGLCRASAPPSAALP